MTEQVLNEARSLGFPCQLNDENNWQILPQESEANWKLTATDNLRWILSMKNIPQLYLNSEEAIAFLTTQAR
jgi:hypothetical protein